MTHPEKPGAGVTTRSTTSAVEGYTGVYNTAGQLIACEEDEQEPVYASAQVSTTEGTCFAAGTVVPGDKVNAEFDPATYENGQYKIVAHATGDAVFPQGPGVSPDGKTKTFEGPIDPMLEEGCEKIDICHATPRRLPRTGGITSRCRPPESSTVTPTTRRTSSPRSVTTRARTSTPCSL